MPSLPPVDVSREWTAVQVGPFVGRVSNLTGNHAAITVATSPPAQGSAGIAVSSGLSVQLQSGETLYARAYQLPAKIQLNPEFIQAITFPLEMMTDEGGQYARLRTDNAQTGFFAGREFRFIRKLTSPVVFRFTFNVPVILFEQTVTVSEGGIELYAWEGSNVTASGTWSSVPTVRENTVNASYVSQTQVASGGEVVPIDANNYRDYMRLATSTATAQRSTVGGAPFTERYLTAGVYYAQFTGTGQGSYSLMWEERP